MKSVVLEGIVKADSIMESSGRVSFVSFLLEYKACTYNGETISDCIEIVSARSILDPAIPLREGACVRVVGRLRQSIWTDENGRKRSKISVFAESVNIREGVSV